MDVPSGLFHVHLVWPSWNMVVPDFGLYPYDAGIGPLASQQPTFTLREPLSRGNDDCQE